jgi:hypothetical protein
VIERVRREGFFGGRLWVKEYSKREEEDRNRGGGGMV